MSPIAKLSAITVHEMYALAIGAITSVSASASIGDSDSLDSSGQPRYCDEIVGRNLLYTMIGDPCPCEGQIIKMSNNRLL